jgi:hypothetical protein
MSLSLARHGQVTLQVLVFLFNEAHLLFNDTDEVRTAGTKKPARDPDGLLLSTSIIE